MKFFDKGYYKLNKNLVSIYGIWPYQSLFMRCFLPITVVAILVSIGIAEVIRLCDVWPDTDNVIDCMSPTMVMFIGTLKLFNSSYKIDKMRNLLKRISEDWEKLAEPSFLKVLNKYAARGHFSTVGYLWYFVMSSVIFLSLPVIPVVIEQFSSSNETRPKVYHYQVDYRVNPDDYYWEIVGHAVLTTFVTITLHVATDTLYVMTVEHGCALFEIVGVQFKTVTNTSKNDKHADAIQYRIICKCVDLHKQALEYANLLESYYSTIFAFVISIAMVTMSVAGVQTVMKLGDTQSMFRFGILASAEAYHLYYVSVPGQKLMNHSVQVHEYAYGFNWYEMSFKTQKLLLLIMMRSLRPCCLTAGKVYIISMENFSSVMRTSMSYFTVLTSMR